MEAGGTTTISCSNRRWAKRMLILPRGVLSRASKSVRIVRRTSTVSAEAGTSTKYVGRLGQGAHAEVRAVWQSGVGEPAAGVRPVLRPSRRPDKTMTSATAKTTRFVPTEPAITIVPVHQRPSAVGDCCNQWAARVQVALSHIERTDERGRVSAVGPSSPSLKSPFSRADSTCAWALTR